VSDDGTAAAQPGIRIGAVSGVPVYLRPSWFVVALVVTVLFAPNVRSVVPEYGDGASYVIASGFALLLLFSVFVHELAHAAAAKATGTPATHIVLDLWGGHTAFENESAGPWRSILVAAVGPLSNAALAVAAGVAIEAGDATGVPYLLLQATSLSNLIVAVFNALPGLPLDGGRVLEGLVWRVTGDRNAGMLFAGWSGRVVAVGVAVWVVYPWLLGEPRSLTTVIWMLLVAGLLWQGAGGAIALAHWRRRSGLATVRELLRPAVAVPSTATVAAAREAAVAGRAAAAVVLDVYGNPAGVVDEAAVATVPPERAGEVPASAVSQSLAQGAVVGADLQGDELIERMQANPAPRYVVVADGGVVGILEWQDVARFVSDRSGSNRPGSNGSGPEHPG
jgi:Zn-dependent protease